MDVEIDLWLWPLKRSPTDVAAFARYLSPAEIARARRFVRPEDSAGFTVGRGRMREILADYVGKRPEALAFTAIARGKPALADGPAFNLSHSAGRAALAVAADPALPLGVDIEAFRPIEPGFADRFFAPGEAASLSALPPAQQEAGFFRVWTRKEAVIKAIGTGLFSNLHGFEVSLAPGAGCALLRAGADMPPTPDWAMHHLDLGPRFVGAIAAVSHGRALRVALREGGLPLE